MDGESTLEPRYDMAVGEWKRRIWRWANSASRHRTLIGVYAEHASMADLTAYPSIATLMAGYEKRWRSIHPGNQYSSPSYRTFQRWLGEVRHYGAYTIVEQRRGKKDTRDNLQPQWYTVNVVQFDFNLDLATGGLHDFLAPWPEPGVPSVPGLNVSSEVSPQVSSEVSPRTGISNKSMKKSVNTSAVCAGSDAYLTDPESAKKQSPDLLRLPPDGGQQSDPPENATALVKYFCDRQMTKTGFKTTQNQAKSIRQAFARLLKAGTPTGVLSKSIDRYWDQRYNKTVYAPGSHYLAYASSDIRLIREQENVSDGRPEEWAMTYSSSPRQANVNSDWSLEF